MKNIFSNVQQQTQSETESGDGVPWWIRYAGKGAGVVGGSVAVFFGVWCAISIYPMCIVAGVWQIFAGVVVIVIEVPFCCMFFPPLQKISDIIEGRPAWQKAALYLVLSLPPIFMCAGLSTFIGSTCIFVTSVLYGMMTLGRKASRDEMVAAAGGFKSDSMNSGLVGNIQGQDVEAKS